MDSQQQKVLVSTGDMFKSNVGFVGGMCHLGLKYGWLLVNDDSQP